MNSLSDDEVRSLILALISQLGLTEVGRRVLVNQGFCHNRPDVVAQMGHAIWNWATHTELKNNGRSLALIALGLTV